MIAKIIKFELLSGCKNLIFYLFILLMIFQGVWYVKGTYDYFVNEAVLMNASSIFFKNLAGGGLILVIIIAIVSGTLIYKDIEHKTAHSLYTYPINEKRFLLGKFFAAFIINLCIALGYLIGMILAPYSGIGDANLFGPTPILQLLQGYCLLLAPNIFILTSFAFFPVVLTKRHYSGYFGVLLLTIIFIICEGVSANATNLYFVELLDPFGYVHITEQLDKVPTALKNTTYVPLHLTYFINKLIWVTLALLGLFIALKKFTFASFITSHKPKKKPINEVYSQKNVSIPLIKTSFSFKSNITRLLRLSIIEFKNITRPIGFKVVLAIVFLLFILHNFMLNSNYYIGPEQPLTTNMTHNRIVLGVFIMLLLMIWTVELLFKEKTYKIVEITDTTALPIWIRLIAKFLSMSLVAVILITCILFSGILTQIVHGFSNIEWSLYGIDLLGAKWGLLTYFSVIGFPYFFAGITGKRLLTHVLSIGTFIFLLISVDLNIIEDIRFIFTATLGIENYSEIMGYGIYNTTDFWFGSLWLLFSIICIYIGIYFWHSGTSSNYKKKLQGKGIQLNWLGKSSFLVCFFLFIVVHYIIYQEVHATGNYKTITQEENNQALYEKRFAYIKNKHQPVIKSFNIALELFPSQRKASYSASFKLENNATTDTLYINLQDFTKISTLKINNQEISPSWVDDIFNISAFSLPQNLKNNKHLTLFIVAEKKYNGFVQTGTPQEDLTYKGLLITRELFPKLGYNTDNELKENRIRKAHQLLPITSSLPKLRDIQNLKKDYISKDAINVTGTITIGGSITQKIVTGGIKNREWAKNERHYIEYYISNPTSFEMYITSFPYAIKEQPVNNVHTTLYYHPTHTYNLQEIVDAISNILPFLEKKLDTQYPYKKLSVVEVNEYAESLHSMPNAIFIPENHGWYADLSNKPEKYYVYFSIATTLIKQTLLKEKTIANVQGAEMLKKALPQTIALQAVKEEFGEEAVTYLLNKKKTYYEKHKANEPNKEPILIHADNKDYLEANKGVIALYYLANDMGEEEFNTHVAAYLQKIEAPIVFKSLYTYLLQQSTSITKKTRDLFEKT